MDAHQDGDSAVEDGEGNDLPEAERAPSAGEATASSLAQRAALRALLFVLLTWPSVCAAQELAPSASPVRLTDRGRIMLDGELSGYWSSDAHETPSSSHPDWLVSLTPGATYFVHDHIGVGANVTVAVSPASGSSSGLQFETRRRFALVGLHLVFDIPLGKRVSILARVGAAWGRIWSRGYFTGPQPLQQSGDEPSQTLDALPIVRSSISDDADLLRGALSLPLVWHLGNALGVGLGPEVIVDQISTEEPLEPNWIAPGPSSSGLRRRIGLSTWLGGSF